jgi:hypothetical protein
MYIYGQTCIAVRNMKLDAGKVYFVVRGRAHRGSCNKFCPGVEAVGLLPNTRISLLLMRTKGHTTEKRNLDRNKLVSVTRDLELRCDVIC